MRTGLNYIIGLFLFLSIGWATAQEMDKRQYFSEAEKAFEIGRIDQSIQIINDHLSSFHGTLQVSAYRLLALCYLAQDERQAASEYVDLLLRVDPYYSISINDPERFAELVRRKREGQITLVTASQQIETLEDAPVPVTLITEEMIKALGATNLQQVLAAYVPGITSVEGNMLNVAMHGVYASSQEKILIMLDGHRLNSRGTNAEAPDFRHSLDKIKQIEVLRGPASSLYGNVALTAVVNIISKSGSEVNGLKASYGMGDNSTYKTDLLFGKRLLNTDIMAWASLYSSSGEKRIITHDDPDFIGIIPIDGYAYLGGFNNKPSYDVGFHLQWGKLKFLFNQQHSKRITPYTSSALHPTIYDYDRYRKYNGTKPGNSRLSTHGELGYSDRKGDFSWGLNAYIDAEKQINYDVSGDTLNADDAVLNISSLIGEYIRDSFLIQTKGVYQVLEWEDVSYGASATGNLSYQWGQKQRGNLLFGAQVEKYALTFSSFALGDEFDRVDLTYSDRNTRLPEGSEYSYSGFMQVKHYFLPQLILNGGLRFDYKYRYNGKKLHALSPRLSIIYKWSDRWNMKLSYARSFVDAPYFYRANRTKAYQGYADLNAEHMDAIQLSATANIASHWRYDGNIYYNSFSDLVYFDTDRLFNFSGALKLAGMEHALSYTQPSFKAHWNLSYHYLIDSQSYMANGNKIHNVPTFNTNLVGMGKILSFPQRHSIWLRGNLSVSSRQIAQVGSEFDGDKTLKKIPGRALLNLGGIYTMNEFELSIQCFNLLGNHYSQGGPIPYVVPQQGRSWMAKLTYSFH